MLELFMFFVLTFFIGLFFMYHGKEYGIAKEKVNNEKESENILIFFPGMFFLLVILFTLIIGASSHAITRTTGSINSKKFINEELIHLKDNLYINNDKEIIEVVVIDKNKIYRLEYTDLYITGGE